MVKYITSDDDMLLILSLVVAILLTSQYIGDIALLIPFIIPIFMFSQIIIYLFMMSNISLKSYKIIFKKIINRKIILLNSDDIGSAITLGTEILPIILVNPNNFETSEQMVGAINHEIGHIKNNHVLKNIILISIITLFIVSILLLLSINILSIIVSIIILYISRYIIGTVRYYQELEAENYSKNMNKDYIKNMRKSYQSRDDYESDNIHPEPSEFIDLIDE